MLYKEQEPFVADRPLIDTRSRVDHEKPDDNLVPAAFRVHPETDMTSPDPSSETARSEEGKNEWGFTQVRTRRI